MKLSVNREVLSSALELITGAAASATAQSTPILQSVLLTANETTVTAVTTNQHLRMSTTVPASVAQPGSRALPASKLVAMIAAMPAVTINLAQPGDKPRMKLAGGPVVFEIPTFEAEEFPAPFALEKVIQVEIKQTDLVEVLRHVAFSQAVATDRPALNGASICIERKADGDATFTAIATDGRTLARSSCATQAAPAAKTGKFSFLLPRDTVNEIVRVAGRLIPDYVATAVFGKRHVSLSLRSEGPGDTTRDIEVSSVLVDAVYPEAHRMFDSMPSAFAPFEVSVLRDTLQRSVLVCAEDSMHVDIEIGKDTAAFKSRSAEFGSVKDTIPLGGATLTTPVSICLNPRMLLGMLKPFSGDVVRLHVKADGAAAGIVYLTVVDKPDYRGVVVQIRKIQSAAAPVAQAA